MTMPKLPKGCRELTDAEMQRLPEGTLCYDKDIQDWGPSGRIGRRVRKGYFYVVPITPAADHQTPMHYAGDVTPWDLEKHMESSGNAFVDSRRTDAIEYCFRMKGDLLGDLKKARHCLDAAIKELEEQNP